MRLTFTKILVPLFAVLALTACTSAAVAPSTTIPETAPEPTFTATVEPTKSPAQIAAGLEGLNQERTYIVRGEYLVDTYNQAPKAVLQEDGTWRELDYENADDAEVMYGHLVLKDIQYIDPEFQDWSDGSVSASAQMIYLGEILWEEEEYKGEQIDMAYLLVGLRDKDGKLHVAKYGADAPEAGQEHWYDWSNKNPEDGSNGGVRCDAKFNDMIASDCWIKPGDIIIFSYIPKSSKIWRDVGNFKNTQWPLLNGEYRLINAELFNQNKDKMMTDAEWQRLPEGEWPDRTVYLYSIDKLEIFTSAKDWE